MNGSVLNEAIKIINGERNQQYGSPEDSFSLIAKLWNIYLAETGVDDFELDKRDVAFMMMLLKVARELNGHKRDNIVDLCGYAGLYADMAEPKVVYFTSPITMRSCDPALTRLGITAERLPEDFSGEGHITLIVTSKSHITEYMKAVETFLYVDDYADYGQLVRAIAEHFDN